MSPTREKRNPTGSLWTWWSRSSTFLFLLICLFVYLFGHCVACGILVPHQGSNPCLLQWKHSLNYWTAWEAPLCLSFASDSFAVFSLLQTDTPGCLSTSLLRKFFWWAGQALSGTFLQACWGGWVSFCGLSFYFYFLTCLFALWPHWVFIAGRRLSLVMESWGYSSLWALDTWAQ